MKQVGTSVLFNNHYKPKNMRTTLLRKMAVVFGCVALLSAINITLQAQTKIYYLGSETGTY
ncbi:MAG: hypothetical protein LBR68_01355, partial [Lachnoclostridium sp.]|nr:hypothetical protein [Lachnoclostridium sp.]